jgi:hypothetical protein
MKSSFFVAIKSHKELFIHYLEMMKTKGNSDLE